MIKGPLIVTGCQRSGTAFVTRALAHDLELEVFGEKDFLPTPTNVEKLSILIDHGITDIIVQCPSALNMFVDLYHILPGVCFVGVMRDTEDIVASMKRISWRSEDIYHWPDYMYDHIAMMNRNWESLKVILPESCWTEVQYTDFEDHPLFVPKEQRKLFTVNQWSPFETCGPATYPKNLI